MASSVILVDQEGFVAVAPRFNAGNCGATVVLFARQHSFQGSAFI